MKQAVRSVVTLLIVVAVCATTLGAIREIGRAKIEIEKVRQVENVAGNCVKVKQ